MITGTQGTNGWYTSNVTVNWIVEPPPLSSTGCDAVTIVADTPDRTLTCSADWSGGTHIEVRIHIHRDATAPTAVAVPARAPDSNGWYNHSLAIAFTGTDATSGIAACTRSTYAGPDTPGSSIAGSCRDQAGNMRAASMTLKYDATAPKITTLAIKPAKQRAELSWRSSPDTGSYQLTRSPGLKKAAESVVFSGSGASTGHTDRGLKAGRKYVYKLTATDVAGNKTTREAPFVARGALLNPAPGEEVSAPPLLTWTAVRGAGYYNVVLVRGRKVYSAWPSRSRVQLQRRWVYRGRHKRLRPGLYRWFVWPGFGSLSEGRYGRMLGGSTFVVKK